MTHQNANSDNSQIKSISTSSINNNVYSYNNCCKSSNVPLCVTELAHVTENVNKVNTLEINSIDLGKDRTIFNANLSKNTSELYSLDGPNMRYQVKKDLLEYNYDPVKYNLRFEQNTIYVKDVFEIFQALPTINKMIQSKPEITIFEQILVEKTDSAEIKKFIRKVNNDMIGYSCNHNGIDEKVNKVFKNAVNIYRTEEHIE